MTNLFKIISLLVYFTITISSPLPNHDLNFRSRQGHETPTSQRRASLHELLRMNRNIASVFRKSPTSSSSDVVPLPPSIENNKNRRVLVLADGEDMPNYVYDEINDDTDVIDDSGKQHDDYKDSVDNTQTAQKEVGDKVTQKYANNFGSAELPSYADPSFFAAVMSQADQANYRYPVENKGAAVPTDHSASESAKIDTYANSKAPEINPYEMFPPSFHELLDIPIHVYANGTSYNPHDKFKNQKSSPTVIRGYSNTHLDEDNSKNHHLRDNDIKPKRLPSTISTSQSHLSYFESQKISTPSHYKSVSRYTPQTTTTTTTETTTSPASTTGSMEKKIEYEDSNRNLSNDDIDNQYLPSFENDFQRNPSRPSLRFRTTAPATMIRKIESITTASPPSTKTSIHFMETTSRTLSPLYPSIRQGPAKTLQPTIVKPSLDSEGGRPNSMDNNVYTPNDESINNYKNDNREYNQNTNRLEINRPSTMDLNNVINVYSPNDDSPDHYRNENQEYNQNIYRQEINRPNIMDVDQVKIVYIPNDESLEHYRNENREYNQNLHIPEINRPNTMSVNELKTIHTPNDESSNRYKNVKGEYNQNIKSFESSFQNERNSEVRKPESSYPRRDYNKPAFDTNHFTIMRDENEIFFTSENKNQREPSQESDKGYSQFPAFPNFKSNFGQEIIMEPVRDGATSEKISSKQGFKPSYIDPFIDNMPVFNPFDKSNYETKKVIMPTTFRPLHFLSREQFPKPTTFRPTINDYSNIISPKIDSFATLIQDTPGYFQDNTFEDNGTPFTNSHSFVKPFRQYKVHNDVHEKQEPQLERGIPVYVSSPIHNTAKIIQQEFDRFDQHPTLSIDLQPPPNFEFPGDPSDDQYSLEYAPSTRRLQPPWNTNGQSSSLKRRPSFLQKFGIFKPRQVNRSGVSSSKAPLDEMQNYSNKEKANPVDYVLSNGPAPVNGKKVVVIGPFKEPPIGAPLLYPQNENFPADSPRDRDDPSELKPSSSQSVIRANSLLRDQTLIAADVPKQQRNFKLSGNNIFDPSESRDIVVQSKFEVGDQIYGASHDYKQGSVMSVDRFDSLFNKVPVTSFNQNSIKQIPISKKDENESKPLVRSAVQVNSRNYNLFEEVSEEDKNRLIAAKFEIPRVSSVRRSGLQRHIIPIPVPMMTASGQQVLNFQNIEVPPTPVVKKVGRLLDTTLYNNIEKLILPSSNEVATPFKMPLAEIKDIVKKSDAIVATNLRPKPLRRKISAAEEALIKLLNLEQPQSYREPSVSNISFGGWQAVGASPVQSYVKESSPFVIIKSYHNQNKKQKENDYSVTSELQKEQPPTEVIITEIVQQ